MSSRCTLPCIAVAELMKSLNAQQQCPCSINLGPKDCIVTGHLVCPQQRLLICLLTYLQSTTRISNSAASWKAAQQQQPSCRCSSQLLHFPVGCCQSAIQQDCCCSVCTVTVRTGYSSAPSIPKLYTTSHFSAQKYLYDEKLYTA